MHVVRLATLEDQKAAGGPSIDEFAGEGFFGRELGQFVVKMDGGDVGAIEVGRRAGGMRLKRVVAVVEQAQPALIVEGYATRCKTR